MDLNELIEVLNHCGKPGSDCYNCKMYFYSANCLKKLCCEAADTLESQQKRIADLEAELKEERHRHDRYVDFELAEAEELRKLKEQNRWIPVTERLPENDSDKPFAQRTVYNVFVNGFISAARYGSNGGNIKYNWWVDPRGYVIDDRFRKVTHWKPAPEPPKEGK